MAEKTLIVVGAGMAGLAAGCYGRMNGYRTRILEMHGLPGGLCTAWEREGYTIDGCVHWLVGSSPGSPFHRIWKELGAVQGRTFVDHDVYLRVEGSGGGAVTFFTDLDRLREHLLELSPPDREEILGFLADARSLARFRTPVEKAPEAMGVLDGFRALLRILPHFRRLRKWGRVPVAEFAQRFRSPLLREAFGRIWLPESSMLFVIMTLAWLHNRDAGYPLGGSLPLVRAIEKRYRGLGGEVRYGARVTEILVEKGRAVGVRLADGSEEKADFIVSAADLHATVFDLLGGRFIDRTLRGYFETLPVFPPLVHVALGVNGLPEGMPGASVAGVDFPLETPFEVVGTRVRRLWAHHYGFDPSMAPRGKTVVKAMFPSSFPAWRALQEDPSRYVSEKMRVADRVLAALDRRFPGTASRAEMCDVATPLTFQRYTGNWQGSFEGWVLTPENWTLRMWHTLPGLKNLWLAGQWVEPGGGLPPAALSGRGAVQMICKADGKRFRTATPEG